MPCNSSVEFTDLYSDLNQPFQRTQNMNHETTYEEWIKDGKNGSAFHWDQILSGHQGPIQNRVNLIIILNIEITAIQ